MYKLYTNLISVIFTDDLKDIIIVCLSKNPEDRPTIKEIYQHSWMTVDHDEEDYVTSDVASDWSSVMPQESIATMSTYSSTSSSMTIKEEPDE